jgi:glycerol kinase
MVRSVAWRGRTGGTSCGVGWSSARNRRSLRRSSVRRLRRATLGRSGARADLRTHPGNASANVARAVLESIAYQVRDVFDVMQEDAGIALQSLLADGGAARNDQLMQFQADILGCPVLRNSSPDVSALGVGFMAGLATGIWSGLDEIAALPQEFGRFEPRMSESRRAELHDGWQAAIARARYRPPA